MALGDLAFEETGKFAGIRALPDGKVEATYQGSGKLVKSEANRVILQDFYEYTELLQSFSLFLFLFPL